MVRHTGRVVDVQVADVGVPVVGGLAVLAGLVHVAQRAAVAAQVDQLADPVVRRVGGQVGVPLDHRAHDVGGGLVEAAGLARVVEGSGGGGDAVGHLVAGHVDLGERCGVAAAVTVRHAEAVVAPERVHVVGAVVHPAEGADAVVADAAAAEGALVEVPGGGGAELGVHGGRFAVGRGAVAEVVAGVGEQRAAARGAVVHVGGGLAAAGGVLELVLRAALRGGQRDLADEDAVAGAGRGLHLLVGGEHLAGGGVGEQDLAARGAVGAHAFDGGAVGQARAAVGGPDHQLGLAGLVNVGQRRLVRVDGHADSGLDRAGGLRGGLVGRDLRGQARQGDPCGDGLGDRLHRAVGLLVDDQVAADHRQAGVGALEAQVASAVLVHHGVLGDELFLVAEAERLGERAGLVAGQREHGGVLRAGLGLQRGGGGGLGGGAHLDHTGQQGRGREYGDSRELSLHVRVLPGNRVWARSRRVPGAGSAPVGRNGR